MACDMPEPFKFPSLDSFQKRFLWTYKEVDLAAHPVVGLLLQVENIEKFPHALGFESLDHFLFFFFFFFRVNKQDFLSCNKCFTFGILSTAQS